MTPSRVAGFAIVAFFACFAPACGGSVVDDATDGAIDAAIDAATDTLAIDTARAFDVKPPFDTATKCPDTVPPNATACGPIRFDCTYKGSCGDDFAQCVDGTWTVIRSTCSAEYCPIRPPVPGDTCATEGFICEYPAAPDAGLEFATCGICTCKGGTFYCGDHPIAECPLRTCKTGDPCPTPGMIGCEFGGKCGTSCRCDASGKLTCSTRLC
jgi:hypothetical protein